MPTRRVRHPDPASAPRARDRARDGGYTLTEVLVAIVLMGIAVIPTMMAGIINIRPSSQSRTAARTETVLGNAADRVNRASEGCNYDVYVQAAALTEGWAASTVSATYQWYEPAGDPTVLGTWHDGACPGVLRPDGLVQKVTIHVTSPDGRINRTMVVVKSDV